MKVVICGPFTSRSGYGDHARSIFKSLLLVEDIKITVIDVRWGDTPQDALSSANDFEKEILTRIEDPSQINFQPDVYIDVRIPNEFVNPGKFNIGITAGIETNIVSPAFLQGANNMDLLIVPSQHAKQGFIDTTYKVENEGQPVPGQELKCTVIG